MINQLSNLFHYYSDAVVGIKNQAIVFFNPAARELFKEIELKLSAESIILPEILEKCGEQFAASAIVKGYPMEICGSVVEDIGVIIMSKEKNTDAMFSGILESIIFQMRESLSVLSVATNLMSASIEKIDRPDMEGNMSIILHSYYKLVRTSQNISSYVDASKETPSVSLKNTDIVSLVNGLINTVRGLIKDLSVNIKFECSEASHIIAIDKGKFTQMILNLLSNSLKHTDPGDNIVISLMSKRDKVVIGIKDSGRGVPSNKLHTSLDNAPSGNELFGATDGLGLGVSLASSIARLHGGTLIMESREGMGTSVKMTLPDKQIKTDIFREGIADAGGPNMHDIYTQLSDILSSDAYSYRYLD